MANVIFCDSETKIKCLKKHLTNGNDKIVLMSNKTDYKVYFSAENDYYLVVSTKLGLVNNDVQDFVKLICENNIGGIKFSVILIEDFNENAEIIIKWFSYLRDNYGVSFELKSELSESEFIENPLFFLKSKEQENLVKTKKFEYENNVTIYTDGACSGNPGAGGWGIILMADGKRKEFSGFEKGTTNNKMELTAVIVALSKLKKPCNVVLYSDSAYVVNAINQGWLENWKSNGWKGADKKPVKNVELWLELDKLLNIHNVKFNKVKGHADNEFNNRCDALATGEITKNANLV